MKRNPAAAYALCSLVVFLVAALGLFVVNHYRLYVRAPFLHPSYFFTKSSGVDRQEHTPNVLWMAPFFSGGGYSSEALSFAAGLLTADSKGLMRFKVGQHGDSVSFDYVYGMNQSFLNDLILLDRKHKFDQE